MIRFLDGLNQQDALQELQLIGGEISPAAEISLQTGINFRLSAFDKTWVERFTDWCGVQKGLIPMPKVLAYHPPQELILHFPATDLVDFHEHHLPRITANFPQLSALLTDTSSRVQQQSWQYSCHGKPWQIDRPLVMGILNITPDSFSDGGTYYSPDAAIAHAKAMIAAGAEIIDLGAESTRPGAEEVSLEEEWRRLAPVLENLAELNNCLLSVDTYKSEIARRALNAGCHIINDISGLTADPEMVKVVGAFDAPLIIMHIKGQPRTMQKNPRYEDLIGDIFEWLARQCRLAADNGVGQIIIDPGIGFGKRVGDNFELIRRLKEFKSLGYPLLLGASRKSFIGAISDAPADERLGGSLAAALIGVSRGANIVRVHDVDHTKQLLKVYNAIHQEKAESGKNSPPVYS